MSGQIKGRSMPAQVSELRVRDIRVKLHSAGRGSTVLFLHGAGRVPQWLPFFDALAEDYELLVPEHPGLGGSADPPWIRSMADLAMFYLDLVEEAGLDRVHLIGNSLGGWLAAEILIRTAPASAVSSSSRRPASGSRACRAATISSGGPRRRCATSTTTSPSPTASWL